MLNIKIDDKYVITADSRNYMLQEVKIAKEGKNKGEETHYTIGYYGKIGQALQGFKEHKIRTSNISNFDELLTTIQDIDRTIKKILGDN